MGKFNLRKKFAKALQLVGSGLAATFCDTRDGETLSDDFARAAFRDHGFEVKQRETFERFEDVGICDGTQATYLLKKEKDDGNEYIGTVLGGRIITPEAGIIRQCWISGDIKPRQ